MKNRKEKRQNWFDLEYEYNFVYIFVFLVILVYMKINPPVRWTRFEAAEHLRCSISTVIRYESQGLESHRIGPRMIRLWADDVIGFKHSRNAKSQR